MHLYIIRHGESLTNLPDAIKDGGIYDLGLTERGHAQAAALAQWLPYNILTPDVLYSSTLMRTRETTDPIEKVLGLQAIYDDRIREIGNNLPDGRPVTAEEKISYTEYWASGRPFASSTSSINGETLLHFRTRVGLFLHEIIEKHAEQVVVVVCHGFVIDTMMDTAYNVGPFRNCEVWTSNTGVTHLQYIQHPGRERWRMHYQNRVEHLRGIGGLGLTVQGMELSE